MFEASPFSLTAPRRAPSRLSDCSLCSLSEDAVWWGDGFCAVVSAQDARYPGYLRVIWRAHVAEMSDLSDEEAGHLWRVLMGVERALRQVMRPDKINLASFGNYVPHLHWHVIPRYRDDPHFPEAYWASAQRPTPSARGLEAYDEAALRAAIRRQLEGTGCPPGDLSNHGEHQGTMGCRIAKITPSA